MHTSHVKLLFHRTVPTYTRTLRIANHNYAFSAPIRARLWHNTQLFHDVFAMGSSNVFGCEFLENTTCLLGMLLVLGPGFAFLVFKLTQVDDAFKLQREFMWMLLGTVLFAGEITRVRLHWFLANQQRCQ